MRNVIFTWIYPRGTLWRADRWVCGAAPLPMALIRWHLHHRLSSVWVPLGKLSAGCLH